jgi:hypothetical protein
MKLLLGILSVLAITGLEARADDYGSCYYDGTCFGAACCVAGRCVYSPGPCRNPTVKKPSEDLSVVLSGEKPAALACYAESVIR